MIKEDIREFELRMTRLEAHVANLFGDLRANARLDRIDERLVRVEHRLGLQP